MNGNDCSEEHTVLILPLTLVQLRQSQRGNIGVRDFNWCCRALVGCDHTLATSSGGTYEATNCFQAGCTEASDDAWSSVRFVGVLWAAAPVIRDLEAPEAPIGADNRNLVGLTVDLDDSIVQLQMWHCTEPSTESDTCSWQQEGWDYLQCPIRQPRSWASIFL